MHNLDSVQQEPGAEIVPVGEQQPTVGSGRTLVQRQNSTQVARLHAAVSRRDAMRWIDTEAVLGVTRWIDAEPLCAPPWQRQREVEAEAAQ
jgi:hypothetical protein